MLCSYETTSVVVLMAPFGQYRFRSYMVSGCFELVAVTWMSPSDFFILSDLRQYTCVLQVLMETRHAHGRLTAVGAGHILYCHQGSNCVGSTLEVRKFTG